MMCSDYYSLRSLCQKKKAQTLTVNNGQQPELRGEGRAEAVTGDW
jgi:hypothetical protein